MSIWDYRYVRDPIDTKSIADRHCIFCRTALETLPASYDEDEYFNLDEAIQVAICPICGWWKNVRLVQEIKADDEEYERYSNCYAAIGGLKPLDLSNISIPVSEVRKYLAARYEKRFDVHPRVFEETVASVFADLGYGTRVTNYSNDGGIDVILDGPNDQLIGVQVKRYRDSISVEQIRSLTGALVIGGFTKGVFVTTSTFQRGVKNTSQISAARGFPIQLMDASSFLSALKIAQRNSYDKRDDPLAPFYDIPYDMFTKFGIGL
jgi:restriction system protein